MTRILGISAYYHDSAAALVVGAFLAGLIIAESEYSHHIVADILDGGRTTVALAIATLWHCPPLSSCG